MPSSSTAPRLLAILALLTGVTMPPAFGQERGISVQPRTSAPEVYQPYANKYALCIGVNKYEHIPGLDYAEADARGVAKVLSEQYGFKTVLLLGENAKGDDIRDAIRSLNRRAGPEDAVLFYFAGHGHTAKNSKGERGFILPQNANVALTEDAHLRDVDDVAIPMNTLGDELDALEAKHVLILLDSCFSGFASTRSSMVPPSLLAATRYSARQVITAGTRGEKSLEYPEIGHGVFTYVLIELLTKEPSPITGSMLGSQMKGWVAREAESLSGGTYPMTVQSKYLSGNGDFVFLRPTTEIALDPANTDPDGKYGLPQLEIVMNPRHAVPGQGVTMQAFAPDYSATPGDTLTWRQTTGPKVELANSEGTVSTFVMPAVDEPTWLTFELSYESEKHRPVSVTGSIQAVPAELSGLRVSFDRGDQGWRVVEGSFPAPTAPQHEEEGGYPGGQVFAAGSRFYWTAPESFVEQMRESYGHALSFDLNQSRTRSPSNKRAVLLKAGEDAIYVNAPYTPQLTWTNFNFRIDERHEWFDLSTNQRVDAKTLRRVLKNLDRVQIRGWWHSGEGECGLDNVRIIKGLDPAPGTVRITSNFDSDDDGWTVGGGKFGRSGVATQHPTGGSWGGELTCSGSGNWYWLAPPQFLGNMSSAYGQHLSFELSQSSHKSPRSDRLVELVGGGHSLYMDGRYYPAQAWTGHSVRLHESEEWMDASTRKRASKAQVEEVLADLSQIKIRGWYSSNKGVGGIDNVRLDLVPDLNPRPVAGAAIEASFDGDLDGWAVAGGAFPRTGVCTYNKSAKHLEAKGSGPWYWIAPPRFRGDLSQNYGGSLEFSLRQSRIKSPNTRLNLVIIDGGGYSIGCKVSDMGTPGTDWTDYSIALSEATEWYSVGSGDRIRRLEFKKVLADVQHVKILGWVSSAPGVSGLDNVRLSLPE